MPFFLLVLGLSIPLWILGSIVGGDLLPGLPVSAVQFLCPVTAASLLLYRRSGAAEVAALLKRSFDFTRITDPVRYVSVLLLIPAAYGLSYIIILVLGRPVAGVELNLLAIPLLLVIFFIGGLAESWDGQDTRSTRCSVDGARCGPRFFWARSGPCGTGCRCWRPGVRGSGLRGGRSARCRCASCMSGFTTALGRVCSVKRCFMRRLTWRGRCCRRLTSRRLRGRYCVAAVVAWVRVGGIEGRERR